MNNSARMLLGILIFCIIIAAYVCIVRYEDGKNYKQDKICSFAKTIYFLSMDFQEYLTEANKQDPSVMSSKDMWLEIAKNKDDEHQLYDVIFKNTIEHGNNTLLLFAPTWFSRPCSIVECASNESEDYRIVAVCKALRIAIQIDSSTPNVVLDSNGGLDTNKSDIDNALLLLTRRPQSNVLVLFPCKCSIPGKYQSAK